MIAMIYDILIYPGILFIIISAMLYSGIMRKLAARMQNRIGPPIYQVFYDIVKLAGKENIRPVQAKPGYTLFPAIALASALTAGLLIPVYDTIISFPGDYIAIIYFLLFSSAAMFIAGYASSNNFAVVGAIRGIVLIFAYELPFIIAIIVPVLAFGLTSMHIFDTWLIACYPLAALSMFLAILAKVELPPFHIPNAHQEIVGGYTAEFTGRRLALIELATIVKTFVLILLMISIYLGGAQNIFILAAKSLAVLFALTMTRVLFARLRIEQALRFYWLFAIVAAVDLLRVIMI
ncbi:MAG: NADH-quinone oxidoreductase subunit H [Candidatus Aenigmarchaeota archaeon]|nr:NADH-quinone oxidoreductase subunit H [Candidatus Aenigmarchaeota archaeon]